MVLGLSGLLAYLIAGQLLVPGFTDFWGYMVFQMAVTLIALVGIEVAFARHGGLSQATQLIVVTNSYLDVLGTAGGLYGSWGPYDKVTHFMGTGAVTAGAWDVFRCAHRAGWDSWMARRPAVAALCVGNAAEIGWEVYENLADKVFHTKRVQGASDVAGDIISGLVGSLVVVAVLVWYERRRAAPSDARLVPASTDFHS